MTAEAKQVEAIPLTRDVPGIGPTGAYLIHDPNHPTHKCAVVKPVDPKIIPVVRRYLSQADDGQPVEAALRCFFVRAVSD